MSNNMQVFIVLSVCLLSTTFAQTDKCGGLLEDTKGAFQTPNYPQNYPADLQCTWVIKVPTGSIVELKFLDFDVDEWFGGCDDADVVQVFDGDSDKSPALHASLCGSNLEIDLFRSKQQYMTVVLKTSAFSMGRPGFSATFAAKPANATECVFNECGGQIQDTTSCKLQSPGYPSGYASNLNCTWVIHAPANSKIQFQFEDLSMDSLTSQCNQNNVTLYDSRVLDKSSVIYESVCDLKENNLQSKDAFVTSGATLIVVLRTSLASTSKSGFSARFTIVEGSTPAITSTTTSKPTSSVVISTTTPTPTPTTTSSSSVVVTSSTPTTTATTVNSKVPSSRSTTTPPTPRPPTSTQAADDASSDESADMTTVADEGSQINNAAAVSGLVIGCIVGLILVVFAILLVVAFVHWKRQNHRFNIRLQEEDARSDVNTLISSADSRETVYKGKKYGKIVRIPTSEEFSPL